MCALVPGVQTCALPICTFHAMDYAAKNGHLEIVEFLHEHRTEGCTAQAMNYAAKAGHLAIVEWLHKNRLEGCTVHAMDFAARHEIGSASCRERVCPYV